MKPEHTIALIIDGRITYHRTLEDALREADNPVNAEAKQAHIFTHQMTAKRGGWEWDSTLPKPKKASPHVERAGQTWTPTELEVLEQAYKDGMPYKDIAATLHRPYTAVSAKITALKLPSRFPKKKKN